MAGRNIAKYLNPWGFRRDAHQQRFDELRRRDGDNCRRCRRPMRFDLPSGDDQAPTIEHLLPKSRADIGALDNLCLCHGRCNPGVVDATPQVQERMRRRA